MLSLDPTRYRSGVLTPQPSVPRTTIRYVIVIPAMNRWAIFDRPLAWTECQLSLSIAIAIREATIPVCYWNARA